ncbi:MAG: polysaccharide deacetylase family protein [Acidobacteria bacterium]|nr:polysaccharide deacetylase family protein [Acidobacteriota bacterium]
MKKTFLNLLYKTGGFAPFHRFNRNRFLILTYHRFSETETPFAVSRRQFAAHLAYLTKYRKVLSFDEISEHLQNGEKLPENAAIVTIDDGYHDAYEIAFPLLKKFGAPATLFAITDFIDGKIWVWTDKMRFIAMRMKAEKSTVEIGTQRIELENKTADKIFLSGSKANSVLKKMPDAEKDHEIARIARELKVGMPDLPPETNAPLSWTQAREMDASGVSLQSHSVTHPMLTQVSENRLNFELNESKQKLEEILQKKINAFCYPSGMFDENVWQAVKRNAYRCAVTTRYGFNREEANRFLLNRIDAQPDVVHFAQTVSGFEDFRQKF